MCFGELPLQRTRSDGQAFKPTRQRRVLPGISVETADTTAERLDTARRLQHQSILLRTGHVTNGAFLFVQRVVEAFSRMSVVRLAVQRKKFSFPNAPMKHLLRIFALIVSASFYLQASAATVTVTNTNDAGAGSLRAALASAIDGDGRRFGLDDCETLGN